MGFMKGGEEYMTVQYDQEIADLDAQEKEDELMFGDDNTWTRKAVLAIEDAKQELSGLGNPPSTASSSARQDEVPESWETAGQQGQSTLTSAMKSLSVEPSTSTATSLAHATQPIPGSSRAQAHAFYFYHALPNFFLSPLDIRILKTAFRFFGFPIYHPPAGRAYLYGTHRRRRLTET